MKISKDKLYVADIMTNSKYSKSVMYLGDGISIGGDDYDEQLEANGDCELLINHGAYYIAVKDLKGDLHYLKLKMQINGFLEWPKDPEKRKIFIKLMPECINDRFYKNIIQLFPNDKKKMSIEELKDLRIKLKYMNKTGNKDNYGKLLEESSESGI